MVEQALKKLIHETINENPKICRMESDIGELKHDVSTLKTDVALLSVNFDQMKDQIKQILDGMSILLKNDRVTDIHEEKIETKYVNNRDIHQPTL